MSAEFFVLLTVFLAVPFILLFAVCAVRNDTPDEYDTRVFLMADGTYTVEYYLITWAGSDWTVAEKGIHTLSGAKKVVQRYEDRKLAETKEREVQL